MINKTGSGKWRVRVKSKGEVVADQTFDRKADAALWEAKQKRALTLGDFVDPRDGKETLSAAIDRWMTSRAGSVASKTLQTEGYALQAHIPPKLGHRPIASIHSADLDALYGNMLRSLARPTVMRFRNTLSSFFGWAERNRLIQKNIVLESRVPRGRGQDHHLEVFPFDLAGLRRVHQATVTASPSQGDLTLVLGLSGLRWGELVALRVRDLQSLPYPGFRVSRSAPDGQPIRTSTKGGATRTVPLPGELAELVAPLAAGRSPNELLFTSPAGGRLNGPNWKRAVDWSANCEGRRVHDLRHTAATLWLTNGVDPKTVQAWLGHSTATLTLDTYSHWIGTDGDAAAVARIDALLDVGRADVRAPRPPDIDFSM